MKLTSRVIQQKIKGEMPYGNHLIIINYFPVFLYKYYSYLLIRENPASDQGTLSSQVPRQVLAVQEPGALHSS